jgi:hypothetical protein
MTTQTTEKDGSNDTETDVIEIDGWRWRGHEEAETVIEDTDTELQVDGSIEVWSNGSAKVGIAKSPDVRIDGWQWVSVHKTLDMEYWVTDRIAENKKDAVRGAKKEADFRTYIQQTPEGEGEYYPEWVARTGGTIYSKYGPKEARERIEHNDRLTQPE